MARTATFSPTPGNDRTGVAAAAQVASRLTTELNK